MLPRPLDARGAPDGAIEGEFAERAAPRLQRGRRSPAHELGARPSRGAAVSAAGGRGGGLDGTRRCTPPES